MRVTVKQSPQHDAPVFFEQDFAEPDSEVIEVIKAWLMAGMAVLVDGQPVALTEGAASTAEPAAASPDNSASFVRRDLAVQVRDYEAAWIQSLDAVRRLQVQWVSDMQGVARRFSQMAFEQEKLQADERARQRELNHKAMEDLDLLERSIKAVELNKLSSVINGMRPPREESQPTGGLRVGDILEGFKSKLTN